MKCPHCGVDLPITLFTAYLGSLGKGKCSERKAEACRRNGLKGGRPKKVKEGDAPKAS